MCWFSGSKKLSKYRRIARKDVLVRKLVMATESPYKVVSYFAEFEYELGKTYYDEELSILNGYGSCHYVGIFVGFNSYRPYGINTDSRPMSKTMSAQPYPFIALVMIPASRSTPW
jgi:hypothetical protein